MLVSTGRAEVAGSKSRFAKNHSRRAGEWNEQPRHPAAPVHLVCCVTDVCVVLHLLSSLLVSGSLAEVSLCAGSEFIAIHRLDEAQWEEEGDQGQSGTRQQRDAMEARIPWERHRRKERATRSTEGCAGQRSSQEVRLSLHPDRVLQRLNSHQPSYEFDIK